MADELPVNHDYVSSYSMNSSPDHLPSRNKLTLRNQVIIFQKKCEIETCLPLATNSIVNEVAILASVIDYFEC